MEEAHMQYRALGNCGTKVSVFGLGGWLTFGHHIKDDALVGQMIRAAFDAGVNFFDTADIYAKGASESIMGGALRELPRHELVISSKLFWPMSADINDRGLSRKHIMESVHKSLARIGTDYLDIYFCHRFDDATPLEETARAMDDLIHQGKILYWGTSVWSGAQLTEAHALCREHNLYRPQVEQPEYNLLRRRKFETDVLTAAQHEGMGLVCWSPLCMGILAGKYDQGIPPDSRAAREQWLLEGRFTEEAFAKAREFKSHADAMGCSRAQLALAWVATQPGVSSVILGASTLQQLQENLKVLKLEVTPQCAEQLNTLFPVSALDSDG